MSDHLAAGGHVLLPTLTLVYQLQEHLDEQIECANMHMPHAVLQHACGTLSTLPYWCACSKFIWAWNHMAVASSLVTSKLLISLSIHNQMYPYGYATWLLNQVPVYIW